MVGYLEEEEQMNWDERITQARIRKAFTEEDCVLARSFDTCAVGELRGIERLLDFGSEYEKGPRDIRLYNLGVRFYDRVAENRYRAARICYKAIRARGTELGATFDNP